MTYSHSDTVEFARELAIYAHGNQSYNVGPFVSHLDDVACIVRNTNYNIWTPEMEIAAYLHDIIEDTKINLEAIESLFGDVVAHLVYLVTDEPGRNRKERRANTYAKTKRDLGGVALKLADRYANMLSCTGGHKLAKMYVEEWPEFKAQLKFTHHAEVLWSKAEECYLQLKDEVENE